MVVDFRSPTGRECLTLEPTSDRPGEAVSLKLRVEVQLQGFSAHADAWVERLAVADFASSLRELERTRSGEAVMGGDGCEDLELKVSSLDRLGHVALEFRLTRPCFAIDAAAARPVPAQLAGGFELDPGLLPGLVEAVGRLMSLFTAV
jgi:hypothetical protein